MRALADGRVCDVELHDRGAGHRAELAANLARREGRAADVDVEEARLEVADLLRRERDVEVAEVARRG